jgi:Tat protein translocase TatB subunit
VFSVSPAEILTIAAIALIVFGPKRLPEISRKAGSVIRDIRDTASDLRRGFEQEYEDATESLAEVRRSMESTLDPTSDEPAGDTGPGA